MRVVAVLLLAALLAGCPPPGDGEQPEPPPVVDPIEPPLDPEPFTDAVHGSWVGSVESELQFTFPLTLHVTAIDGAIDGVAILPAEPEPTEGFATGSVGDGIVTLDISVIAEDEPLAFTLVGEVVEDAFTGSVYDLLDAGGSFRMERP